MPANDDITADPAAALVADLAFALALASKKCLRLCRLSLSLASPRRTFMQVLARIAKSASRFTTMENALSLRLGIRLIIFHLSLRGSLRVWAFCLTLTFSLIFYGSPLA